MIFPGNVRSLLLAGALVTSVLTLPGLSQAQVSGSVDWNGWTFTYDVSGEFDGLSLKNVQFQGLKLITKISFPVMRVFYDNDACGPLADRVGGNLQPVPWAGNATIGQRTFTLNGRQWYEIGIRDQIGAYDIYQVYYLSTDGILDAHIYSGGLVCAVNHVHYPNWRIDFDIDGNINDQIQLNTGAGYTTKTIEFNANATDAINHEWRVRDTVTGHYVDVLPGFTDFTIPNENTQPVTSYANHTVFGRLFHSSEDTGWTYGPYTQVPFNNGESISNNDIVLWYEGYLPHQASEGSTLWHSTGLRLVLNGNPSPPPTITSFTPTSGPVGTSVTISGTNFNSAMAVTFNGVSASFTVTSATEIRATVPTGATTGLLRVTTPAGTATSASAFTVAGSPPPGGTEAVLWTQLVNVTAVGNSLRKTAGCEGCEDAGAVSSQTITSGDGFVEFTASETTTIRAAGLSHANTDTTSADIDFAIKLWPGSEADVRENELYLADTTYVSGDVFRIAVQSGVIRYSKNGVVFYTSTVAPTFPLLVDTSLYNLNATISNAMISRSAAPPPPPPTITSFTPTSGLVGSTVTITGTNFTGATAVTFNGVSATNFTVDSATTIRATVPTGATTGPLRVTTPGGTATSAGAFTVQAPPPPGGTQTFRNGTAISIPDSGSGSPYPSIINVAGMSGNISKVVVKLNGLSHTYPDDINILLVGPGGQNVILMSDAGAYFDLENVTLTFDSAASASLSQSGQISSGTYRPTNYDANDFLSAPAPGGPYGSSLSVFNQTSPNGSWRLWVYDGAQGDSGSIAGGWEITITTN